MSRRLVVLAKSQAETHCRPDPLALWLFSINSREEYLEHIQCLIVYDSEDGNTACHTPMKIYCVNKRMRNCGI